MEGNVRIDSEAEKALVTWKSVFATEVREHARRIAAENKASGHVTMTDYRQALELAVPRLLEKIRSEDLPNGERRAA